jgi:hypothetical protein
LEPNAKRLFVIWLLTQAKCAVVASIAALCTRESHSEALSFYFAAPMVLSAILNTLVAVVGAAFLVEEGIREPFEVVITVVLWSIGVFWAGALAIIVLYFAGAVITGMLGGFEEVAGQMKNPLPGMGDFVTHPVRSLTAWWDRIYGGFS